MRSYKTHRRLWFVLSLISFVIIGIIPLFSAKGVHVSLGLWLWQIVTEVIPSLFWRQVGFLEVAFYVLVFSVWLVIAAIIGWLFHGFVIIICARRHERSRPSA